jgi:hypothetical protein
MASQRRNRRQEKGWARRARRDLEPVPQLIDRTSATVQKVAEALRALVMVVGLMVTICLAALG